MCFTNYIHADVYRSKFHMWLFGLHLRCAMHKHFIIQCILWKMYYLFLRYFLKMHIFGAFVTHDPHFDTQCFLVGSLAVDYLRGVRLVWGLRSVFSLESERTHRCPGVDLMSAGMEGRDKRGSPYTRTFTHRGTDALASTDTLVARGGGQTGAVLTHRQSWCKAMSGRTAWEDHNWCITHFVLTQIWSDTESQHANTQYVDGKW